MRSAFVAVILLLCLCGCNDTHIDVSSSQHGDGKWSVNVTAIVDVDSRSRAYRMVAKTLETQAKALDEAAEVKANDPPSVNKPEAEAKPVPPK